ncbi:MAG TPA: inositol monophosphatase family protein [Bacteroidota bacterium]|nr:inositol monophosphatase family protein [Bacteroidota bacterium]
MIEIAITAARTAGTFLKQNVGKIKQIEQKYGQEKNLVTEIDKESERIIIEMIRKNFPDHAILAEEGGLGSAVPSAYKWIIDPLDGTTNYTHGFPVFCVSIGIEHNGVMEHGVIYDPNFDELFTATRGKGAFVNGKPMRVSKVNTLSKSLLVTGFPYNIAENPDHAIEHFGNFLKKAQAVRRMGSAAIDLAYVACGRYEGFWEVALHPWDVAAGKLLVEEAGGKLTDFRGNDYSVYEKQLLATNGLVHEEMKGVLREAEG